MQQAFDHLFDGLLFLVPVIALLAVIGLFLNLAANRSTPNSAACCHPEHVCPCQCLDCPCRASESPSCPH